MSQEKAERNRRLDLRRNTKRNVKITCRKGGLDLGPNVTISTLNISETGVRLLITEELSKGQEVTLTLESQDQLRPLRLLGEVAWCQQQEEHWQIGVRFNKRLNYRDFMRLT